MLCVSMNRRLAIGTLGRGEPGAPVGDWRRGASGLLCAKPLHRASKYSMFVISKTKNNNPFQSL